MAAAGTSETPVCTRHAKGVAIADFYEVDEATQLGSGSFSTVYRCKELATGREYAVKKILTKGLDEAQLATIDAEIEILLAAGSHDNIVFLKDVFQSDDAFYLVMEIVSGGELFDRIVELQFYSEEVARVLLKQVLEATSHIHKLHICHRDLKPENLLLESSAPDSPVKLADFGLSSFCKPSDKLTKAVGTPGYIAPEILMTLDEDLDGYNVEVDEWSIGIIMYILLCGFPPFYAEDDDECFDMIIAGEFDFPSPYWDNISEDAKDLLRKLLVVDPAKRLTADQALEHKWIAQSAGDAPLTANQAELKKFQAKQRWKKAINTSIALQKFAKWGKRASKAAAVDAAADTKAADKTEG